MTIFSKTFEDPEYYDDYDAEEGDWQEQEDAEEDIYGPYGTVNS